MASRSTASAQTGTCDTSGTVNGSATPVAGIVGDTIVLRGTGFTAGEDVSFWFTLPDGSVAGTPSPVPGGVNPEGSVGPLPLDSHRGLPSPGNRRRGNNLPGAPSNHQAIIYFCIGFRQAEATPTAV